MSEQKRIGIYSGTFDPVHNGHLSFARIAAEQCRLDKVFFLPEPRPRQKQAVKAYVHRVVMIEESIKNIPVFGVIRLEQQQFSIEGTLPVLVSRFKGAELAFLFGEDVVMRMLHWANIEKLLSQAELIVGVRKGEKDTVEETIKSFREASGVRPNYNIVTTSDAGISSSEVRLALARRSVAEVPKEVMDYVSKHGLYASNAA